MFISVAALRSSNNPDPIRFMSEQLSYCAHLAAQKHRYKNLQGRNGLFVHDVTKDRENSLQKRHLPAWVAARKALFGLLSGHQKSLRSTELLLLVETSSSSRHAAGFELIMTDNMQLTVHTISLFSTMLISFIVHIY